MKAKNFWKDKKVLVVGHTSFHGSWLIIWLLEMGAKVVGYGLATDNEEDNYDLCKEVKEKIDYKKHPYLNEMKDYILPKSIWVIGGDGFAYDIGFGGLDHVLSKTDNINISLEL